MNTFSAVSSPKLSYGSSRLRPWLNSLRLLIPVGILSLLCIQTLSQNQFIHVDFIFYTLALLGGSFFLHAQSLIFEKPFTGSPYLKSITYIFDVGLISSVYYFSQSSFTVSLYILLICISAIEQKKDVSIYVALFCCTILNFTTLFTDNLSQNLWSVVLANNGTFLIFGWASHYLGKELHWLGRAVVKQGEQIEKLEDVNKLIIENISSGLIVIDKFSKVLKSNNSALKVLDDRELSGSFLNQKIPEIMNQIRNMSFDSDKVGRLDFDYEISLAKKKILGISVSPIINESNERNYILLIQDLTEIKNLEEAMKQEEKLAAVGRLAAGIAHEIRNPLASISGSVQMMKDSKEVISEEDEKLMGITLREINRLNGLISEFLDFVKLDILSNDPINVNELVKEVAGMLKVNNSLRKDIKQELQLESRTAILGNYGRLKQAILNITINAYQAMAQQNNKPALKVMTYNQDDKVVVKIVDTGEGMSAEDKKRIFEPFHTTKEKGTGLGLSITHKIIENHNAKIFVESEAGEGTEFRIEFPASPEHKEDESDNNLLKLA